MPRLKLQGGKELIIFRFNCNEIKSEKCLNHIWKVNMSCNTIPVK